MRIGIIGGGVVGHATARSFMEHADVRVYDSVKEKSTHSLTQALEGDLVFVCLPTPQKEGSLECDISYVETFFAHHRGYLKNFVLRSTVPVGTTMALKEKYHLPNLVHSPEFLTARCAVTDAQIPARNIIGHTLSKTSKHEMASYPYRTMGCETVLENLYKSRFPGVPVLRMTSSESEMVKLMLNSFFGVKLAFMNEGYTLAEKLGLNWDNVIGGILSDGRVAHAHTKVPGDGNSTFGWGGHCIPKDLANFIDCLTKAGLSPMVSSAALTRNQSDCARRVPKKEVQ